MDFARRTASPVSYNHNRTLLGVDATFARFFLQLVQAFGVTNANPLRLVGLSAASIVI